MTTTRRSVAVGTALALSIYAPMLGAHSGGTDEHGCHTDSRTGDYHCHEPGGGGGGSDSEPETELSPNFGAYSLATLGFIMLVISTVLWTIAPTACESVSSQEVCTTYVWAGAMSALGLLAIVGGFSMVEPPGSNAMQPFVMLPVIQF